MLPLTDSAMKRQQGFCFGVPTPDLIFATVRTLKAREYLFHTTHDLRFVVASPSSHLIDSTQFYKPS
jgi:hypothetical protein